MVYDLSILPKPYSDTFMKGIYIPIFSSAIYDLNVRLIEGQQTPINLASAMIGACNAHQVRLGVDLRLADRQRIDRFLSLADFRVRCPVHAGRSEPSCPDHQVSHHYTLLFGLH